MAIQRQHLHDDLLAVIAASRELPAEYDYLLADSFLRRVDARLAEQPEPSGFYVDRHVLNFVGALAIALALLILAAALAMHGVSGGDGPGYYHSQIQEHGNLPSVQWNNADQPGL